MGSHMKLHIDQSKEIQLQSSYDITSSLVEKEDFSINKSYSCSVCHFITSQKFGLKSVFLGMWKVL